MASRRRGQCTLCNYGAIRRNSLTLHPHYRYNKESQLPTGLGQALYTRFHNLPALDLASAAALVLAFSEFDDSEEAWRKYDKLSFRDLCVKLGVSKRLYDEAFEPMILTGLFAPGEQCSAAAALGMAYFFVLKHQQSFDVRWAKGDIGEKIFAPWVEQLEGRGVRFLQNTKAVDFEASDDGRQISAVRCAVAGEESIVECDDIVFALGGGALGALSRSPAQASPCEDEMRGSQSQRRSASHLHCDGRDEPAAPYVGRSVAHGLRSEGAAADAWPPGSDVPAPRPPPAPRQEDIKAVCPVLSTASTAAPASISARAHGS